MSVFFIDDKQVVRPNEIGSADFIREQAKLNGCHIIEYELEAQFRCAGSNGFVSWVNNTLGIERTANTIWEGDQNFDFCIFSTPDELEAAIRQKAAEGFTARMTAGFCWPWSKPRHDGTLVEDVHIGNFRRPWNANPDASKLAPGIPKASLWAYESGGIDQVGCIYTAQGFEYDYAGVIVGPDLTYSLDTQTWKGHTENSYDSQVKRAKGSFVDLVKNTYRVLFSRGMKGCYVYFMDKDTERFFKSRIEVQSQVDEVLSAPPNPVKVVQGIVLPFRRLQPKEIKPYENCVPLYDLKAAAGHFSEEQQAEDINWVELPDAFRPQQGLFVTQVVGESMNRRIPNGSWCLFRFKPSGTRQGKVVLVQHREIADSETGGHLTVKIYDSRKEETPDGSWRHTSIILRPDTSLPGYEAIVLSEEQAEDLQLIAEFVAVIG